MIPWPYVAAIVGGFVGLGGLALAFHFWRSSRAAGAAAEDMADRYVDAETAAADADYAKAVAAGEKAVAEVDTAAEKEVANAGDFADLMRDLDAGAK